MPCALLLLAREKCSGTFNIHCHGTLWKWKPVFTPGSSVGFASMPNM